MLSLLYNNHITIFPDVSAAAAFKNVKLRLRECSLPYSMLYPARLRVVHKGKSQFFTSPKEANHWLSNRSLLFVQLYMIADSLGLLKAWSIYLLAGKSCTRLDVVHATFFC